MKPKTYNQKAAAYWAIVKANPNISANEIGRRYHKKPLGMRKQERNDLIKEFKDVIKADQYLEKSDFPAAIKKKLKENVVGYKQAKQTTRKGKKLYPETVGYPRRSIASQIEAIFKSDSKATLEFNKYGIQDVVRKAKAAGLEPIWTPE